MYFCLLPVMRITPMRTIELFAMRTMLPRAGKTRMIFTLGLPMKSKWIGMIFSANCHTLPRMTQKWLLKVLSDYGTARGQLSQLNLIACWKRYKRASTPQTMLSYVTKRVSSLWMHATTMDAIRSQSVHETRGENCRTCSANTRLRTQTDEIVWKWAGFRKFGTDIEVYMTND